MERDKRNANHGDKNFPLPGAQQSPPVAAPGSGILIDRRPYAREERARIAKAAHKRKTNPKNSKGKCWSCGADTKNGECWSCGKHSSVDRSFDADIEELDI